MNEVAMVGGLVLLTGICLNWSGEQRYGIPLVMLGMLIWLVLVLLRILGVV
jgi:Na+-translocating ferredoxin:NAD+ oxidoreductase RnfD subunit